MSSVKGDKLFISIGMPVFNGERYIRQALDSLLAQSYENFELIISDNASADRTQEICEAYFARDERIRYCRNEFNMGPTWNFNRVFELSSGEYFMWASHDDYWDSCYIRSCLDEIVRRKSVILVGTICKSIDPKTETITLIDEGFSTIGLRPRRRFIRYKSVIHSGKHIGGIFYGVYKRCVLEQIMPLRNVIASDHLVLAELCFLGEFVTVKKALFAKRQGGASLSFRYMAGVLDIRNPFLIGFPYFVREILLQQLIIQTEKLHFLEKLSLALWSIGNYIRVRIKQVLARGIINLVNILPQFVQLPIKLCLKKWRKALLGV